MPLYRVDCVIPMFTGQPEDIIMNSLHFVSTLDTEPFALSVEVFLNPFYQAIYGSSSDGLANYLDWAAMKYRVFNQDDIPPRVPYEVMAGAFAGASNATSVPTEVAVVASFQSVGVPGERYQRRYNRIYLGGVTEDWFSDSTPTSFPVIAETKRQAICDAMEALEATLDGPDTIWVQVSSAGGSPRSLPVSGGWVDDSPDTQRRRSVEPSTRTTWVPAAP